MAFPEPNGKAMVQHLEKYHMVAIPQVSAENALSSKCIPFRHEASNWIFLVLLHKELRTAIPLLRNPRVETESVIVGGIT